MQFKGTIDNWFFEKNSLGPSSDEEYDGYEKNYLLGPNTVRKFQRSFDIIARSRGSQRGDLKRGIGGLRRPQFHRAHCILERHKLYMRINKNKN